MDPGVKGLSHFISIANESNVVSSFDSLKKTNQYNNSSINSKKGSEASELFEYASSGEWGKLSDQDKQKIVSEMKVLRSVIDKRINRAYKGRTFVMACIVLAAIIYGGKQRGYIPSSWFPSSSTVKIGLTGLLVSALYTIRAPRISTKIVEGAPFHLPILGAAIEFVPNAQNGFHGYLLALARRTKFKTYELTIPGGEHFIFAMDPIDRKYILKDNWKNFLKNSSDPIISSFLDIFAEVLGRGIFGTDKKEWQDHRKITSSMFSANGLRQQMEDVFKEHTHKLINMLGDVADKGGVVDIQNMFQSFTFDTICEIAFGVSPNALDFAFRGEREPFLVAFDYCQTVCLNRAFEPKFLWEFKRYMGIGMEGELPNYMKYMRDYVYNIIAQRKQANDLGSKNDALSLYIQFARKSGQSYMEDDAYLRDVILNFMIAGRDTTACALTNWFKLVGTSPRGEEIAKRIVDECDQVLKSKQTDELNWDITNELTYSDAVFNESIRMYPPVGLDFKIAEQDDVLPSSGFKVPANSRVFLPMFAMGRDPNMWKDPDTFIPERWVSYADDGKSMLPIKRPDEYVLPVFWGGPRLCLGKDMARFEAKLVACAIFKSFRFEIQPHREEFMNAPVMFYKDPVNAIVKRVN